MNKLTLSQDVPLLLAILTLMLLIYLSVKPGTAKFLMWALLVLSILLILFGCSTQKCYPSKKSRDYAVRSWWSKQQSDGYWVHYRQSGFKPQTAYRFECKLSSDQLEKFYDSIAKR